MDKNLIFKKLASNGQGLNREYILDMLIKEAGARQQTLKDLHAKDPEAAAAFLNAEKDRTRASRFGLLSDGKGAGTTAGAVNSNYGKAAVEAENFLGKAKNWVKGNPGKAAGAAAIAAGLAGFALGKNTNE